ncbi:ArsR/SmtB family transcription factor [Bosea sp. NBC_00550]|uniref:ArsR/SmtB family transcription factor n=1 Tax=Bosea sp. NBC_00550 TaxID=2969621 RepID=UPI002231B3D7|nr:helix-turn-helix domain-containing protein [Bosea sp. NBC_00550]UZF94971.1 helix-turn-helix domain-containing protein [Bosea sp. NBC_00550]
MNESPLSPHRGRRSNGGRVSRAEGRQDLGFLVVNADRQYQVLRGLASPVRLRILKLLNRQGPKNINQIAEALGLPQSTIATNVQVLEEAELISTSLGKAAKGQQKICTARYSEIVVNLDPDDPSRDRNIVEVEMPLGLYTSSNVSAPCGFCSTERILGVLDVPELFLDPRRVQAALIWFGRGYVEYKFPNNAKVLNQAITALEFEMEMSSEVPGTNAHWPSDISLWVNERKVGTWTCPGDYGDRRGRYTPPWWKLEGSQYGILTTWRITAEGTFLGERKLSDIATTDLDLDRHHSIRLRIGIDDKEGRPGGINIFGRGFGNHNQDIKMRLHLRGMNALHHVAP